MKRPEKRKKRYENIIQCYYFEFLQFANKNLTQIFILTKFQPFISRALEVFKDHGRRMSEIIEDQRSLPGKKPTVISPFAFF